MTRTFAIVSFFCVAAACAEKKDTLKGDFTGNVQDTTALIEAMAKVKQAQADAETFCKAQHQTELSSAEEQLMGRGIALRLIARNGKPLEAQSKVAVRVGQRIAMHSSRPDLPWTFAVLDSADEGVFGAPGGYVFITRGSYAKLGTEAELAARLAHVVSHVTRTHALKRMQDQLYQQCYLSRSSRAVMNKGLGAAAEEPQLAGFADFFHPDGSFKTTGNTTGFAEAMTGMMTNMQDLLADNAKEELEADQVSLTLLAFSGYDVAPYLAWVQAQEPGDQNTLPRHLDPAKRIAAMQPHVQALTPFLQKDAPPLQQ